jgi:hypothetical protein
MVTPCERALLGNDQVDDRADEREVAGTRRGHRNGQPGAFRRGEVRDERRSPGAYRQYMARNRRNMGINPYSMDGENNAWSI